MEAPAPRPRAAAAQRRREATRGAGKGASRSGCAEIPAPPLCPRYTGSRALIGVVVEATNDGGHARFGPDEMITAVAIATQTPGLPQLIQCAGDLTSVIAADRLDDVGIEHRRRCERLFDGLEPSGAGEELGRASRQRNLAFPPDRLSAVEPGLGPGPPAVERGVHRHSKHSLEDDEILIGLEARSERPFDLPIIVNVDVLV